MKKPVEARRPSHTVYVVEGEGQAADFLHGLQPVQATAGEAA